VNRFSFDCNYFSPHAHGVIKWESKEQIGQAVILTRHSFGTVSTCAEIKDEVFPPISKLILT